jgi:ribonuclease HI
MHATIHIDGGSRGNPGPASYAVVLERPGLEPLEECDTIGSTTNNIAEYSALVRALEMAHEEGLKILTIYSDSELLVKQMRGEYKVKNEDLKEFFTKAKDLTKHFDKVNIIHVRREQNKRADQLCNLALDGSPKPRGGEKPKATSVKPAREAGQIILEKWAKIWAEVGVTELSLNEAWAEISASFKQSK